MTLSAVATRYAKALADVVSPAASAIRPENALAELRAFEGVLSESVELKNALTSPAVPVARKRAVVGRIGDQLGVSRIVRNFLFVLIDHRRIASLTEILHSFESVIDERLGFARADVSSARELSEAQRTALNAQLTQLTGKQIRTRFAVDEALIGGIVARIGSTVYDGSVRGQLQTLGRRLSTER
ncbi:MAG: synthase delta subunit [Candidatus Solibacter sp.]|jgi:F-type H+-transporting ATPase subunit delta|nr:synthase delta subunit [Candidatus Solibacter sp.]